MKPLHERAKELETRLGGEDKRTVHQLLLMFHAFLSIKGEVDDADELLEVIEWDEEGEGE